MNPRKSNRITQSLNLLLKDDPYFMYLKRRPRWCDAVVYEGSSSGKETPYLEKQIATVARLGELGRKEIWWATHYDPNEGFRLYFWAGTEDEVLNRLKKAGSSFNTMLYKDRYR
jgi:hypothetical protein